MICHTSVVDSCIGILTQVSGANQLLTKLLVKSLQLLVLHYTQAWEQLLTGTADCHKGEMQEPLKPAYTLFCRLRNELDRKYAPIRMQFECSQQCWGLAAVRC